MVMGRMTRRSFLRSLAVGAVAAAVLLRSPCIAFGQDEEEQRPQEPRFFTSQEMAVIEAAAERILPSDDGPGAGKAAAARYIDRALAEVYVEDQTLYRQGIAEMEQMAGSRYGASFAGLGPEEQDALLEELAGRGSPWFVVLRRHTIEGCLADPAHGGNKGAVFWRWIGYPGPVQPRGYGEDLLECS